MSQGLATVARSALQALESGATKDSEAPQVRAWRRNAARQVAGGLPSVAQEDWKYTNLGNVGGSGLRAASAADGARLGPGDVEALLDLGSIRPALVVVNGFHRPDLARTTALPAGLTVRPLAELLAGAPDEALRLLGGADDTFTALNNALLEDGVLIDVAPDCVLDEPLRLLVVGAGEVLRLPRIVVRVGAHGRLRLIEQYVGAQDDTGVTNSVCGVMLARGAVLHHLRLETEARGATHIGRVRVEAGEHAEYHSDSLAFGGQLARIDIDVTLGGRGARCRLNGLFVADGTQHIDHHTRVEHAVGDTHSEELYRGILDGRSRGVFNGKVIVAKDAQKISARQTSNNLLLSRHAEIDTKPELEIYADDVTCSHGATVGELDPAALFYLRSRGVPEATARALLVYAFAQRIVDDVPLAEVRDFLERRLLGHTDLSALIDQLVNP